MFSLTKSETHAHVLLKEDHRKVDGLFKEFEQADDSAEKIRVAREICLELTVHAAVEEAIYYPSAQRALGREDDDLIDEARVEHESLKFLISRIDGTGTGDSLFAANMKVLQEYVKHHVREEETELFPKVESEDLDLEALGGRLLELKAQLLNELQAGRSSGPKNKVSVPQVVVSTGRATSAPGGRTGAQSKRSDRKAAARKSTASGSAARKRVAAPARKATPGSGRKSVASRSNGAKPAAPGRKAASNRATSGTRTAARKVAGSGAGRSRATAARRTASRGKSGR